MVDHRSYARNLGSYEIKVGVLQKLRTHKLNDQLPDVLWRSRRILDLNVLQSLGTSIFQPVTRHLNQVCVGLMGPYNLIAQLVEHCTGTAEVMGSNYVQAWIFSSFTFT